jgi:hypothetical protein
VGAGQSALHHPAQAGTTADKQGKKAPARSSPDVDVSELAAAKADLEKMKALLNQMQVNLGFVQTSQTPLKHQFELEIDMWNVLIKQMEHHIQALEKPATPASQIRPEAGPDKGR